MIHLYNFNFVFSEILFNAINLSIIFFLGPKILQTFPVLLIMIAELLIISVNLSDLRFTFFAGIRAPFPGLLVRHKRVVGHRPLIDDHVSLHHVCLAGLEVSSLLLVLIGV